MSEWRPIETAPFCPGERVMLYDVDDRWIYIGNWMDTWGDFGLWNEDDGSLPDNQPTHWMPLPDAPKISVIGVINDG